jgi:hypothetical protein
MDWSSPLGRILSLNLGPIMMAVAIWTWAATHGDDMTFASGWLIGTLIYALMSGVWILLRRDSTQ